MLFQLRLKERYRRIKERSGNSKDVPSGLDSKQSACNAGDPGLISASERSPGGGHGNLLQYSCLENPTEEPGRVQSRESQRVRHDKQLRTQGTVNT